VTPEQFAYWLQGFAELHSEPPTAAQWQSIRAHVETVFDKQTPPLRVEQPEPAPLRLEEIGRILRQRLPEGDDILRPIYPSRRGLRDRLIC
jgi:hypothetical protein